MPKVLELTRVLDCQPNPFAVSGVRIRTYAGPADDQAWLDLRQRAFSREKLGVRAWDLGDFRREFLAKPWWNPARMWFAEADGIIGSVSLASRMTPNSAKPVVHWLMVDPRWRRRGIARMLLATLEAAVWQMGQRQIWLETHSAWTRAEQFYRAMGYTYATTV